MPIPQRVVERPERVFERPERRERMPLEER